MEIRRPDYRTVLDDTGDPSSRIDGEIALIETLSGVPANKIKAMTYGDYNAVAGIVLDFLSRRHKRPAAETS